MLGAMHPLPFLNEGFITDIEDFLLFCYTDGLTETVNEAAARIWLGPADGIFHK